MILNSLDVRNLSKPKSSDLNSELGVSGKITWKKILANKEPTIEDYNAMKNNDGTVWSLYQILKLPILANSWRIDADPEDTNEAQAELVRENFTLPPHKGGMSTPFRLVLSRMLKATLEARASFEKVWTLNEKGQIVYKKIAPRDTDSVTILTDDNGGFAGFRQKTFSPNLDKWIDVVIPLEKCFLFTINKEENELEGLSMFRAAWYHYDRKHRLYYLYEQSVQSGAIPPKALNVLEDNEADDETHEANLAALDDFSTGIAASALIPKGYDLSVPDSGKGRMDAMPGVEHHNAEMARSVLAQFILLSNNGENTGSFALAESHSDIFIMAEHGLMNTIEDHINSYLIPQLVEYNFADPKYPTFKFNDMTDDTRELTEQVFLKIVEKIPEGMRSDFMEGLYKQMASRLGIELDENGEPVGTKDNSRSGGSKKKRSLASDPDGRRRPLTEAEEAADITAIEKKMDVLERQFLKDMKPVYRQLTDQALEDLKPILDSGDLLRLSDLELTMKPEYRNVLRDAMNSAYVWSKQNVSDALGEKIPKTPGDSRDYIDTVSDSIVDKQYSDLTFRIKSAVTAELHKGQLSKHSLAAEDVVAGLSDEFDSFFDDIIGLTGSVIVSEAINRARDDVFSEYEDRIDSYQYSAILDTRVCPLCEALDNTILSKSQYASFRQRPPLHFLCRCILVAILKDQTDKPRPTGVPDLEDFLKYQTFSSDRVETLLSYLSNYSRTHNH